MKKWVLLIVFISLIIVSIIFYSNKNTTIDETLRENNIEFDQLLFSKKVLNQLLFFYTDNQNESCGVVSIVNEKGNYKAVFNATRGDYENYKFTIDTIPSYKMSDNNVIIFYGVIEDSEIDRIIVYEDGEMLGFTEVIEVNDMRLWLYEGENGHYNFEPVDINGNFINE
jgi:hypothetical protein